MKGDDEAATFLTDYVSPSSGHWRFGSVLCFHKQEVLGLVSFLKTVLRLALNVKEHVINFLFDVFSPSAVRQYADICLFSTAQYKCPVAQLEAE